MPLYCILTPCTTIAEYIFSKRLNSLILAIYRQTNIRMDYNGSVDQVAKRCTWPGGVDMCKAGQCWECKMHLKQNTKCKMRITLYGTCFMIL